MDIITQYYRKVMQSDCVPVTMGGEHTLTYPLLRAVAEKHGPVGLIQVFGASVEFILLASRSIQSFSHSALL